MLSLCSSGMTVTSITIDVSVRDRLNAEARRDGVPVGEVLEAMLEERARARRFAELDAAIASTPEPLRSSHTAEAREWDVTSEDGLHGA